ncbi:MAG: pilin, partial [Patescibacteria group bacterium]|nr:pilin [Patescibacteria group bacterium]
MKNTAQKILKYLKWNIVAMLFIAPLHLIYAQSGGGTVSTTLQSPLGGVSNLNNLIEKILEVVVDIGTPIAVLFIIYAGFLFVTAQGNETKITKAKNAFTWAIIGTAVLLGAWVLALAIEGTIGNL